MTRAFELQKWLREHGPATYKEIRDAGFTNFGNLTRDRMISYGSIERYHGPNPHSETLYARVFTTLYFATDKDYKPLRGNKPGAGREVVEAALIARAISTLAKRGYTVVPPTNKQTP